LAASMAAGLLGGVSGLRVETKQRCEPDDVSFAEITAHACSINWQIAEQAQGKNHDFNKSETVSCWKRLAYNTDKFLSSILYQHEDGRCVIGMSGYHGALVGYMRGVFALLMPPVDRDACGARMYAPFLRLLRHHTALGNWSKMVHLINGDNKTCTGPITIAAESMGGSAAEMLAYCGNNGMQGEVQDPSLPNFQTMSLYSYGAPASSSFPLNNSLREDGCFKGKRILFKGDPIATFIGAFKQKHAYTDTVLVYGSKKKTTPPAIRVFECRSDNATTDRSHKRPRDMPVNGSFKLDGIAHSVYTYRDMMQFAHNHSFDDIFAETPVSEAKPTSMAAQYLNMIRGDTGKM